MSAESTPIAQVSQRARMVGAVASTYILLAKLEDARIQIQGEDRRKKLKGVSISASEAANRSRSAVERFTGF